jgi:nitrite reductase/ring-hydroxylating ferredoxin subunit
MYPLNANKPWPENQWYVAGLSNEIGHDIIGRDLLGRHVILFRDEAGAPHALSGICPHRMLPLEQGRLKGDRVMCGYHGLEFDLEGRCVRSPITPAPPSCALARYPVREHAPLVWIWMGDAARAETTPLPEQELIGLGAAGWRSDQSHYYDLEARYSILIDNLFDLSHLGFIHADIMGEAGAIAFSQPYLSESDGRLVVSRDHLDCPVDPYHRSLHPGLGDRLSTRLDTDMLGICLINAGGPVWDGPDAAGTYQGSQNFIHVLTPASECRTHYWVFVARDFRTEDDGLSFALADQARRVADQDLVALEAIERLLASEMPLPREVSMKTDQGALRARHRLLQMINAEDGPSVAA